ncbi:MAG: ATP-binding cassette domain-containing protein, partial [Gammaproteobacteria bacterium]
MSLLTLLDVSLRYGDQVIFRNADFSLEPGERVCLIGRNGAGKSTLLRLITGQADPDEGEIRRRSDIHIAQLEQALPRDLDSSVRDFVAGGLEHQQVLIDRYRELAGDTSAQALRELESLQRRIEVHGGWD